MKVPTYLRRASLLGAALGTLSLGLAAQPAPNTCAPTATFVPSPTAPLILPLLQQPVVCPTTVALHFERWEQFQFNWSAPLSPLVPVLYSQWFTRHPGYASGVNGAADQYRVEFEQEALTKFLRHFALPAAFGQDEDYQPLDTGGWRPRLVHAVRHLVVTESADHSHEVFNMEGIPAAFAVAGIGNYFEPGSQRTWGNVESNFLWGVAWRVGSDVLSEFSPTLRRLRP